MVPPQIEAVTSGPNAGDGSKLNATVALAEQPAAFVTVKRYVPLVVTEVGSATVVPPASHREVFAPVA